MHGASSYIITPGASLGFKSPGYRAKIASIAELTTKDLEGTAKPFAYKRPLENQEVVRVTIEFCAANRHLRVMISDYRSGAIGGVRVVNKPI
jgi:hypothetical protein